MSSLDEARDGIRARRARRPEVANRYQAHLDDISAGRVTSGLVVVVRCDHAGHNGGRPKLAELHMTRHGAMFASKITYAPSDQLTLRPWEREHLLGAGMDDLAADRMMSDDDALLQWLTHLDEWGRGHTANGPRWLMDHPPHTIVEVIDLPDTSGRLGLWTRCPRHLAAEDVSVADLMSAARRGQ